MARVKGSAVRASVAYLQEKAGQQGFERILARMNEADRTELSVAVLQSSWYEVGLLYRLMDACDPDFPPQGARTVAWDMGRFSADYGLKTLYRIFFRVADPHFIIRKASQVFSSYYEPGKMETVNVEPRSATLRLTGFNQPSTRFCERLQGWMERTLELCGAQTVVMSHPKCMARGDSCCDYVGKWS